MAYMSQEKKQKIAPVVKSILKKYNVKGSLSVRNHSSLQLTVKSGVIDFFENFIDVYNKEKDLRGGFNDRGIPAKYIQVNTYWYHEHFTGKAKEFLKEVFTVMNNGNHDNSDIQTDYFDVGWYVRVGIGSWDKPYEVTK